VAWLQGWLRGSTRATLVGRRPGGGGSGRSGRRDGRRPGGSWPHPGLARRPRAGNRGAQGRVRAGSADQGRTRRASGPGAHRADLRRAGRGHCRHPGRPSAPTAAGSARPLVPARRRPSARAATGSGGCLVLAVAAVWASFILDPGGPGADRPWAGLMLLLAQYAVIVGVCIMWSGVATSVQQRRSGRQLPPRPGPGGHALNGGRRGGTGRGSVPPGPRADQTCADLRAHSSWPAATHTTTQSEQYDPRSPGGLREQRHPA